MVEVEFKYSVESVEAIREQLLAIGAVSLGESTQTDEYFDDPLRDFAKLDWALRIRQHDDLYFLTFKGPNLDAMAKIRQEIETPLSREAAVKVGTILKGIGFQPMAKVIKHRKQFKLDWQGETIHICLDHVDQVGDFVELEQVIVEEASIPHAKEQLLQLSEALELKNPIRTSYLNMLLQVLGAGNPDV